MTSNARSLTEWPSPHEYVATSLTAQNKAFQMFHSLMDSLDSFRGGQIWASSMMYVCSWIFYIVLPACSSQCGPTLVHLLRRQKALKQRRQHDRSLPGCLTFCCHAPLTGTEQSTSTRYATAVTMKHAEDCKNSRFSFRSREHSVNLRIKLHCFRCVDGD